ncbi:hypothetical protein DSO57_1026574 [Entomophthora muscae]|uniref:Uncharacterized protein n=1 Tax=Entomophthora muscae TaxID=34485 RepID=A0ACC2UMB4_9FUNG|nr:hypothetical protein DSO57_1026574 [Entomophthora muscae]
MYQRKYPASDYFSLGSAPPAVPLQLPPIRGISHQDASVRLPSLRAILWEMCQPEGKQVMDQVSSPWQPYPPTCHSLYT